MHRLRGCIDCNKISLTCMMQTLFDLVVYIKSKCDMLSLQDQTEAKAACSKVALTTCEVIETFIEPSNTPPPYYEHDYQSEKNEARPIIVVKMPVSSNIQRIVSSSSESTLHDSYGPILSEKPFSELIPLTLEHKLAILIEDSATWQSTINQRSKCPSSR
jgi:hypothetical protein